MKFDFFRFRFDFSEIIYNKKRFYKEQILVIRQMTDIAKNQGIFGTDQKSILRFNSKISSNGLVLRSNFGQGGWGAIRIRNNRFQNESRSHAGEATAPGQHSQPGRKFLRKSNPKRVHRQSRNFCERFGAAKFQAQVISKNLQRHLRKFVDKRYNSSDPTPSNFFPQNYLQFRRP